MSTLKDLFTLGNMNFATCECTKQSRWKETTQRYISNMLYNNICLRDDVLSGRYVVSPTIDFKINERGRTRQIEAPVVRDRIVQKIITKRVLFPNLARYLIYDNYASLPMRGTAFARRRLDIMLKRYISRNGIDGYIMLLDIRKYFESIDHEVLKEMIYPYIAHEDKDVVKLINYIIDKSSHNEKGLNLGSEAPQILAIFYLYKLDNFIKIVKGIKYYGRYMDDIFLIGKDKEELRVLLGDIEKTLEPLKLTLNKGKSHIVKLTHGFTYLQVKYNISSNGKIIKRPSHNKIVRERRRLKSFKSVVDIGKMSAEDVYNCYKSWRGTFTAEHNAFRISLKGMDAIYRALFPNDIEHIPISRKTLCKGIYKDGRYLSNVININTI